MRIGKVKKQQQEGETNIIMQRKQNAKRHDTEQARGKRYVLRHSARVDKRKLQQGRIVQQLQRAIITNLELNKPQRKTNEQLYANAYAK